MPVARAPCATGLAAAQGTATTMPKIAACLLSCGSHRSACTVLLQRCGCLLRHICRGMADPMGERQVGRPDRWAGRAWAWAAEKMAKWVAQLLRWRVSSQVANRRLSVLAHHTQLFGTHVHRPARLRGSAGRGRPPVGHFVGGASRGAAAGEPGGALPPAAVDRGGRYAGRISWDEWQACWWADRVDAHHQYMHAP